MKNTLLSFYYSLMAASEFQSVGDMLSGFFKEWWGPLLAVLAGAGIILGAVAGIRFWMASASGDEQKLKAAKAFILHIFIGYAIIFVLAALIPVLVAAFSSWFNNQ